MSDFALSRIQQEIRDMAQSSVTPIRAGTKALPEKVFDACDQLAETKGDFRNEDVLTVTGGGMGTVARLVKTWRQHQHIIKANDALSAEATITLVEMLDKLVQQQIARSTVAVNDFLSGAAEELTELSQTLEARQAALETTKNDARELREQLKERDEQLTQTKTRLADRDRELTDANARTDRIESDLKNVQGSHSAKLEQLSSQHQHQLAQALEAQRRSMDAERLDAVEKQENAWKDRLNEAQNDTRKAESTITELQSALHEMKENAHQEKLGTRELEGEISTLKRLHLEQMESQQAFVDEKHQSLVAAQSAQRQLTQAIEQQLASHNHEFEEHLRSLAGAASGVTSALSEIDVLMKEIRESANASRRDDTSNKS